MIMDADCSQRGTALPRTPAPGGDFAARCAAIDAAARQISALLEQSGEGGAAALEVATRLRTEPFRVLVIGEFSRGKSTFLNALVGEKLLPSSVRPTTSVISVIRNGPARRAVIHWRDKSRAPDSIDLPEGTAAKRLDDVVTAKNAGWNEIARVEITLPLPHLALPFEFVDTPGVNDIDTMREEVTYSYLSRADAAIMLLDLQQPLSASERRFLVDKVMGRDVRRLFFVVNKVDQSPPETRDRALRYVRDRLDEIDHCRGTPVVAVAAKLALQARQSQDPALLQASLFPEFERQLLEFLEHASGASRIATAARRLERVIAEHRHSLEKAIAAVEGGRSESLRAIAAAEHDLGVEHARIQAVVQSVDLALARYLAEAERDIQAGVGAIRREAAAITRLPEFPNEPLVASLRTVLDRGLRAMVEIPAGAAERAVARVLRRPQLAPSTTNDRTTASSVLPGLTTDLDLSPAETDPAASQVGGLVGGFIGAALLGPFGSIPFAMLGGWLGSVFGAKPSGSRIETSLAQILDEITARAHAALEGSSGELRGQLHEQVVQPEQDSLSQRAHALDALRRSSESDAETRRKQGLAMRQQLGEVERIVADLRSLEGVA